MHSIGIPDQYIKQRSGHKDARILQQIYRNPLKSQSNVYVKKTNEYFSSQFEKEIKKKRDNG
jgi:hypothetical protein